MAVPLGLIVNELLTNAIQHSQSTGEERAVHVVLSGQTDDFSVSVSDQGSGPDPAKTNSGLGTQLIDALAGQINATIAKQSSATSYTVTVKVGNPTPNPH
jgi:two-component sensor histidine kinase